MIKPQLHEAILIVEDDGALAEAFALQVHRAGYSHIHASSIYEAVDQLQSQPNIVAVMLDLGLPDGDGLSLFKSYPKLADEVPVIVVTGDGSINRAIEAMRLGAFDFLVKPIAAARLANTLKGALLARQNLNQPVRRSPPQIKNGYMGFVGTSQPMQRLYQRIARVAPSRAGVLICGESGTGKELCAEALHKANPRAAQPMVAINCGAIPEKLIESQLFGHVKGAFTGAVSDQMGAAQLAHRGTLFLDEICELELHLQVKLLRFIQSGWVQRVGAVHAQEVDVRIVCATNRDPAAEVRAGRLREDLYYRLAVIPVEMPPLRMRGDDILLLANAFLQRFAAEEGRSFDPISAEHCAELVAHHWPGNVRELQNVMRRAAVIEDGPCLTLPLFTQAVHMTMMPDNKVKPTETEAVQVPSSIEESAGHELTLEEIERRAIDQAIVRANGSLPTAARNLGISPSTLYRKRDRRVTSATAMN